MKCAVCGGTNNISCIHFGAEACKACAAFFRRTISMKLEYSCTRDLGNCRVHHEFRVMCRFCRLKKCYRVGMRAEFVQSRRERIRYIRMSRGLVKKQESVDETGELANVSGESSSSGLQENQQQTSSRAMSSSSSQGTSTDPEPEPLSSHFNTQTVLDELINVELNLNDRRRLLYGNNKIRNIFAEPTDCPYDKFSLRIYNYKSNQGMSKQDFVSLMDYAKALPGFGDLNYLDKNYFFRLLCGVDFVMCSAFYTFRCGYEDDILVLGDGSYIPMKPAPMTGYEKNCPLLFTNDDERMKYRTMMPLMMDQWKVCQPFAKLKLTLEEFAVLKGICSWHVAYFRLSEIGRENAKSQKNQLLRALHYACELNCDTDDDVEERYGNLLLELSSIMEQIRNVVCSFVMISFFGILDLDSLMVDMTNFW